MFNLLTPTLADVMDPALDNRPIIISMSPYGRAALGMAGHGAAFDAGSGTTDARVARYEVNFRLPASLSPGITKLYPKLGRRVLAPVDLDIAAT